mmetsp:Transcript_110436/g.219528  ORF Transcript_110436/g.219528 Transcript_110436/m.219528 type:complete len:464 (+) Transcript_110436:142-1533(+)
MSNSYARLHTIRASRASYWGINNPEACGIICVVGVVGSLLVLTTCAPAVYHGFTRLRHQLYHPQAKTLIVAATTTTSTASRTMTTATSTISTVLNSTATAATTETETTTAPTTETTTETITVTTAGNTTTDNTTAGNTTMGEGTTRSASTTLLENASTSETSTSSPNASAMFPQASEVGLKWIQPPKGCCDGERPSIITSAGKNRQADIDGAVMLGLSLQWHVPEFPRLCLVDDNMSADSKELLKAAGWTVVELKESQAYGESAKQHQVDSLAKMNVFRVKVKKALWMDADMYVWDDPFRKVLEDTDLKQGHIAMVKNADGKASDTGLMLLRPSLQKYANLRESVMLPWPQKYLNIVDKSVINSEFKGKVVDLETRFNIHGSIKPCADVVAAQYTGTNKPTLADAKNLQMVSKGYQTDDPHYLKCPKLYKEYFCVLKNAINYLSKELQHAVNKAGSQASCQIY